MKQIDRPVLNDYDLGGYLIYAGMAPFIDGRTELYGEKFYMRWERATGAVKLWLGVHRRFTARVHQRVT